MRFPFWLGLVSLQVLSISGCAYRQPSYQLAFSRPNISCIEIEHRIGNLVNEYACPQQVTNVTAKAPCDESLWSHTYNPQRLIVHQPCISVTGTIVDATHGRRKDGVRKEADGDCHGWLRLDKGEEGLLNKGNRSDEGGNLVYEIVCLFPVTQPDAQAACKDYKSDISLAPVGSHVRITGSFVQDTNHAKWNELHPVSSIEVIQ